MHHSVGGVVAIGAPLVFGGSVAIAERFSARGFWDDVARWECTAFQYIGELCRYLVAAPSRPRGEGSQVAARNRQRALGGSVARRSASGSDHSASSNSMLRRKAMSGSTTSKARSDRSAGSRRTSRSATRSRLRGSTTIPKRPREAPTDFARAARTAKSARLWDASEKIQAARFEGYSEAVETEKKILRNVFKAGDAWMRTGDLMRRDADGFYTFVDRIGDTFRWKGENVATFEVATRPPRLPRRGGGDRLRGLCSRRRRARGNGAC